MVFARFASLITLAALTSSTEALPRVDPSVHRTLREQGSVNLMIVMKGANAAALNSVQEAEFATRGQKIASMVAKLEEHAAETQKSLDQILTQESAGIEPLYESQETFWIANQRFIKGASFKLLEKLVGLPEIEEIRQERILPLPKITIEKNNSTVGILANQWGVTKVNAPTVWAGGNTGQNIVVSHIDTGVRYTHTALKGNWRSSYGWYDPYTKTATPTDDNGHGTHTMGTIAGASGYGVAPGATWISCRGCNNSGCSESSLLTCAQFITCPTTATGTNKDCTKAPDLVSNSWGGGQGDSWYASSVNAWRTAGIVPIFANGNSGPSCGTVNSPGDYTTVIGVGATTSSDGLASFSSKGPSTSGTLKPDVSAPGNQVTSTWNTGDSATNTISGTSMATPHVAGVVALLLSAKPTLSIAQVFSAVRKGVDTTVTSSGYTCGGTADSKWPNNQYGYGRINAVKVLSASV